MRQLLNFDGTYFKLNKTEKRYTKQNLLDIIEREPEKISNNVVTRPVVEEWLFNTVAFIGGPRNQILGRIKRCFRYVKCRNAYCYAKIKNHVFVC